MIGKKINQLATELAPASTDLTIIGNPTTGVSKKITLEQLGAIFSGAVSFYTNLAAFPNPGTINVIYCAKDTKKLYLWSGTAYVEVFPSQALLDTYQLRSEKGVSNGYASLDSGGKVPISQLPSSIMEYKGTWNAATNTPTLANGTGDTGDVFLCNVAGTVNFGAGPITFAVGDYVIYSGTIWQRSSGAVGTVTSVAATITGDAIGITGSPVTTSGTLALAFAGNSTQYVNGAGNLVTFPGVINEAQNLITEVYNKTGATLTKGTVVYINGGQGNLPTVTKALATGDSTSAQTYGIVRNDITNNNNGYVVVAGRISDLDTQAFTEGTQLYLSPTTAGTFTSTKPYAPNHLVYVGIVVRAHPTQGVVEVKIQNGYELDELHNVAAQSPSNGDILQYVSSTSLWTKVAGTTSNIAEGSNLYYTDARSRAALSFTAGSGAYNSTTGVITIPTNTNQLTNGANYITLTSLSAGAGISYNNTTGVIASTITQYTDALARAAISLTTTGTSGAATYNNTTGVLNIPQYADQFVGTVTSVAALTIGTTGTDLSSTVANSTTTPVITLNVPTASATNRGALSSADWTTFNSKQNALTNPVTGSGTTNYLPKFTGASTIGNSAIFENGTNVGINTPSPSSYTNLTTLTINGTNGSVIDLKTANTLYGEIYSLANELRIDAVGASSVLKFLTNSATKMTLDASGNLGLGVTPSAWSTDYKVLQLGGGSISSYVDNNFFEINQNAFWNGTYKYVKIGFASRYQQTSGRHEWYNAPSGAAAGNTITFTQAMTLNASGNLVIGDTSANSRLQITAAAGLSHARWTESATTVGFVGGAQGIITGHNGKFAVRGESGLVLSGQGNSADMIISSTGAATFTGNNANNNTENASVSWNDANANLMGKIVGYRGVNGNDGNLRFYTNNVTPTLAMTLTNSGNVGIGTITPARGLSIFNNTIGLYSSTTGQGGTDGYTMELSGTTAYLWNYENDSLIFGTANSTRMTITSVGNVEIAIGSIKTGEPDTGYGRAAIKIGARNTGQAFNSGGHLPVNIDGTIYFINVYSSLP
jgi:hypothetical protein